MFDVMSWLAFVLLVQVKSVVADFLLSWLRNRDSLNFHLCVRNFLGLVRGHRWVVYARGMPFAMG